VLHLVLSEGREMDIAGGIYREICEVPPWNGVWGSGFRAAIAVSRLGSAVTLHGYFRDLSTEITRLVGSRGVTLQCYTSTPYRTRLSNHLCK
jgi:hypothetical protein